MPKVRFTGRALPAAFNVTIPITPKIHWTDDDLGLQLSFGIQIKDGNVTVDCETNKFIEKTDFIQIYRRSLDLARGAVDLFAFSTGSGVTVFLDKFTKPDGTISDILPGDPSLHLLSTSIVSGAGDFEVLLGIVLTEPTLFRSLRDLIEAITLPHVGAMSSARAMEGIRHLLAPKKDRKQATIKR